MKNCPFLVLSKVDPLQLATRKYVLHLNQNIDVVIIRLKIFLFFSECYDKGPNCTQMKNKGYCHSTVPVTEYEVKTNCLETCEFCGEYRSIQNTERKNFPSHLHANVGPVKRVHQHCLKEQLKIKKFAKFDCQFFLYYARHFGRVCIKQGQCPLNVKLRVRLSLRYQKVCHGNFVS